MSSENNLVAKLFTPEVTPKMVEIRRGASKVFAVYLWVMAECVALTA